LIWDVLLDEALLCYLSHKQLPVDAAEATRVVQASKYIHMNREGKVYISGPLEGVPRLVPEFRFRKQIVQAALPLSGFASGRRIYELLRQHYYWDGLLKDCEEVASASVVRQREMAKFAPPRYLHPAEKGVKPFQIWAVDSITNLVPPAPDGSTDIILAVDPFSKWVEAAPLKTLDSHHTATFFDQQILCRYGCPSIVRSDQGVEYQGEFHSLLTSLGVRHRSISTLHPRANG
jgi:hypothetical protein